MELPHFIGPSAVAQSPLADQERTVNWYPERSESAGAVSRWSLYPTPGVTRLSEGVSGPGKAHFWEPNTGREFCVLGAQFIEISIGGTQTIRGAVAVDANPATISSNGAGGGQLLITAGGNGYCFTLATNVFAQVAALNGLATMGDQLDGYFLVLDANTSTLWISNLLDGTTWDPTQFAQRSIASDPWVSMIVSYRYIYLFGSQTSEVWYDAGSFPFPFIPHPSGLFPYGCAAPFSPQVIQGAIAWLARTMNGQGSVMRISGFTPEEISTDPLQVAMNGYSTIADAVGDTYDDLGHTFYILTLPTADATWAWDSSTLLWCERGTWDQINNMYTAWRPLYHAFAFGEHRTLDLSSASVYTMSSSVATDVDEVVIRRLRRAPALVFENLRLGYGSFELDLEPGLGLIAGQGSDPQVMMRMSNDGGKTWGNELWRSAGPVGEYGKRVRWSRCGMARKRVFEVAVTDPIPWRVTNAYITLHNPPAGLAQAAG